MTSENTLGDTRLMLAADRFFWAILDSKGLSRASGGLRVQLGYLFESVLPLPIERIQAAYAKIAGTRQYLACGMLREQLVQQSNERAGSLVHLGPAELPAFVSDQVSEKVQVAQLNLLIGKYRPVAITRMRRNLLGLVMGFGVCFAGLLVLGLERRRAMLDREVDQLQNARYAVVQQVLPAGASGSQPPELRLMAELRRLRQSRGSAGMPGADDPIDHEATSDSVLTLANLLRVWPKDANMMTESISITPTSIAVRGSTPDSQTVQSLADALDDLSVTTSDDGWRLQQPQVNAGRDGVQATLQLTRGAKGGPS